VRLKALRPVTDGEEPAPASATACERGKHLLADVRDVTSRLCHSRSVDPVVLIATLIADFASAAGTVPTDSARLPRMTVIRQLGNFLRMDMGENIRNRGSVIQRSYG
jgi:hypothetical protein